ncbi:BTAD domain-containing putative transcriptional regulator [Geodermatophilus normandii]|uniref:AfsR/SARP family transcriptional regulator n=1 Tax=Geodermatophilus normandii TaxID=1137989 RepID=A0A6P0G9X3_9ACTN|nr:BTAD domain-containing putative transcriptional regulator [Geodermatophilus normandii]NEM04991.1 AfsR/SARP family transcriptional regulator [Geodermatophilus normandii]
MEIRVLGPVELVVDGRPRSLPGAGERELLALLALSPGRVLAVPALVDALWDEELPANPGNALQVRVSKLRRALTAAGLADVLVTRPPGYLLDVDPAQVDAVRFARLVTEARAVAASAPERGARLYRQALACWRGAALAEFADARWAGPEAARLTDLQLVAREELVDLALAAGRHTDVLPDLESLIAAHPLRERLHARLMLALYRAGRQADALAAYQRARTVLDAELGLAPGADLRGLQEAILQQRPDLEGPDGAVAIPSAPPSPPPTAARPLPPRLTSFLGREADLHRLAALLHSHRLVTVTGPGGVGKTSVAVEAARAAAGGSGDGVGFVRLSGVTDAAQVAPAVLAALQVRDVPTATAEDHLLGHLRDRAVLLVLDNCEHLADACAVLAERLLESCPEVRLLATSREPLAARGEVQCALDPLPVPTDADTAQVAASAAVQLFVDRARSVLPDFRLGDDTAGAVADICRHLDGIPLALELAAARVAAIPVDELAGRMGDRFTLLTTGPRTAEARQRTLRATVDWSHQLLTEPERVLLRRLSVFRGHWTLEAMQAVAGGDPLTAATALDTLGRLVDRSLVAVDRSGPERAAGPRYHLLETVREYAAERLVEVGEADAVARAHVAFLTALAERAEAELRGDGQARWLPRLAAERDDLDAALAWCAAHADDEPDAGLRLVAPLGWYWYFATRPDGGRRVAAMLDAAPRGSAAARARALQSLAVAARPGACIVHPDVGCAAAAARSRALFADLGEEFRTALSDTLLAVEAIGDQDPAEAFVLLDRADRQFARAGDAWCAALSDFVRLELHAGTGDLPAATAVGHRALLAFRTLGDRWGVSAIQFHLGTALHRAGRLEESLEMYQGALASGEVVGPANTVQYASAGAGHVVLLLGDPDRAAALFTASHAVARQLGAGGNPRAAVGEGLLARQRGDLAAARERFTAAQQLLAGSSEPEWTAAALVGLGHVAEAGGDLDGAASSHRRAWRTAPGYAAALEGLACVAAVRGEAADAGRLLGAAASWRQERHRPASRLERADADRAAQRARELLGAEEFDEQYRAGAARPDTVLDDADGVPVRH